MLWIWRNISRKSPLRDTRTTYQSSVPIQTIHYTWGIGVDWILHSFAVVTQKENDQAHRPERNGEKQLREFNPTDIILQRHETSGQQTTNQPFKTRQQSQPMNRFHLISPRLFPFEQSQPASTWISALASVSSNAERELHLPNIPQWRRSELPVSDPADSYGRSPTTDSFVIPLVRIHFLHHGGIP